MEGANMICLHLFPLENLKIKCQGPVAQIPLSLCLKFVCHLGLLINYFRPIM
jgi:hypothetical protein